MSDAPRFLPELIERRHALRGEPIQYRRATDVWPRCPDCERYLYSDGSCGRCDDDGDPGPFAPAEEQ